MFDMKAPTLDMEMDGDVMSCQQLMCVSTAATESRSITA